VLDKSGLFNNVSSFIQMFIFHTKGMTDIMKKESKEAKKTEQEAKKAGSKNA
jgi:hypothetical protein